MTLAALRDPRGEPSDGGIDASSPFRSTATGGWHRRRRRPERARHGRPAGDRRPGRHAGRAATDRPVQRGGPSLARTAAGTGRPARPDQPGAERAGLSVIAYHFAIPNVSGGAAQADYVIANAADGSGRVAPIGLDIEYDPYSATDGTNECYGLSPGAMTSWAAAFSNEVRRRTGRLPILYTTADWWNTCAGSTALGQDSLWVAAYTTGGGPPLPVGWGTWAIWQYTSGGTVPGIVTSGNTDLDVFNGHAVPVFNPGNQATRVNTAVTPVKAAMLTVAGSAAPSYSATGLPPGLTISAATGQISGVPTAAGVYHV